MRAIVTGGAGFIGSYLTEELVRNNISVTVWDNLFRGKMENINHVINEDNHFVNINMADHNNIPKMVDLILKERPSLIFHYAAINGTQYFYDIPAQVLESNSMATYNLMLALREVKKQASDYSCKIIYASSSETYGEPFSLPTTENDITYLNVESVRDSYAASKLIGEFYIKLIAHELGLEYIVLRLFNVYGTRMVGTKYGQVIPEFIHRLSEGEYPLNIYGNGEHMRSFCYVTDNVQMTVQLACSEAKNEIYNIGNTNEVSILELGTLIMNKMEKEAKFNFLPEREGDHKRRCPDTIKLHNIIGIKQYISLEQGIDKMINSRITQLRLV